MTEPTLFEPITWSDFYGTRYALCDTALLVRMIARAEILIASDPVRARSEGEAMFRVGYRCVMAELNARVPPDYGDGDD